MKSYQYKTLHSVRHKKVEFLCKSWNSSFFFDRLHLAVNINKNEPYKYWVSFVSPYKTEKGVSNYIEQWLKNIKPSKIWR